MNKIIKKFILETTHFPGNSRLPLLCYKGAFNLEGKNGSKTIKKIFEAHQWYKTWINGIYDYHHYHSNNHEVLGIATGTCKVQFGGDTGIVIEVARGDAFIIPAGVSHKCIERSKGFSCVGAYAIDVDYDMKEKKVNKQKIDSLPLPSIDPIFGEEGPLKKYWK